MTSSLLSISEEYPNRYQEIKPHRDIAIRDNERMRKELLRQILAANVSRRMEETPGADTQKALAKRAGIGQSHVSRVLNGRQSVGIDIVAAVSGALGCQPWELLADDEITRRAAMERMILGTTPPPPQPAGYVAKQVAHKRRRKR